MFSHVTPTPEERAAAREGDDLLSPADVVMDRGFTLPGSPTQVWPWLQQLGKARAGWYLPQWVERVIPPSRRAIRHIDDRYQHLDIGDTIPDYGGGDEIFELAAFEPGRFIVYTSQRGRVRLTWSITLTAVTEPDRADRTRVHLRLRLGPVRRKWLARSAGELIDVLTIAGMAAGLRQRLLESAS